MKLSKTQFEVMKRLQEGWAMRTGWAAIGYTQISHSKCLQKNGHGKGGEIFRDFTIATVNSLEKKGLIKRNGTVFLDDVNWILTEKGKNLRIEYHNPNYLCINCKVEFDEIPPYKNNECITGRTHKFIKKSDIIER